LLPKPLLLPLLRLLLPKLLLLRLLLPKLLLPRYDCPPPGRADALGDRSSDSAIPSPTSTTSPPLTNAAISHARARLTRRPPAR
ncbi:MAG: hypothetical protein KC468_07765, partial [Myxococcales bacterium]|nr:hypothetical protein [Myxococcales bacterium]